MLLFERYLSSFCFPVTIGVWETTITNNTLVKVTFPSEDYDTASAYDTSNGKFTVPSGQGGKYLIYSQLFLNTGGDSQLQQSRVVLYKNGSQIRSTENDYSNNLPRRVSLTLTTVENLSASDYLEIMLLHKTQVEIQIYTIQQGTQIFLEHLKL